jgi:hypothetical protein
LKGVLVFILFYFDMSSRCVIALAGLAIGAGSSAFSQAFSNP